MGGGRPPDRTVRPAISAYASGTLLTGVTVTPRDRPSRVRSVTRPVLVSSTRGVPVGTRTRVNPAAAAARSFSAMPATGPTEPSGSTVPVIVVEFESFDPRSAARDPTDSSAPADGPSTAPRSAYLS